jgi:hypothetical protein
MLYIASIVLMGIALALVRGTARPKAVAASRPTSHVKNDALPQPPQPAQPATLSITVTPVPPRPSALIIPFPERRRSFARSQSTPRRA